MDRSRVPGPRSTVCLFGLAVLAVLAGLPGSAPAAGATSGPGASSPAPEPRDRSWSAADAHGATPWHVLGLTGSDVAVGIVDRFVGYSDLVGSALPRPAAVRCYSEAGQFSDDFTACERGSVHGTAVAEAVVSVAPGVRLYLANPVSAADLVETAAWMAAEGVRVINFSGTRAWEGPGDGTGPAPVGALKAVDAAVAGGALWVGAAGNTRYSTWSGPYRDVDGDHHLEFGACGEGNRLYLDDGERAVVQARWEDSWTAARSDLDLYLVSVGEVTSPSASEWDQVGLAGQTPYEVVEVEGEPGGWYEIRLVHRGGPPPAWVEVQETRLHLIACSGTGGAIANPAESASPGAIAVGAVRPGPEPVLEIFSSNGPTRDGRTKPDLVAFDAAPSVSMGRWLGTSQATAHVSGLAAILVQAYPEATPAETADRLRAWAVPLGDPTPDGAWGFGLAHLPPPLTELAVDDWPQGVGLLAVSRAVFDGARLPVGRIPVAPPVDAAVLPAPTRVAPVGSVAVGRVDRDA